MLIQIQNLKKIYSQEEIYTSALNGVNMEIKKGEFVSIMGPSGSGKSTLLQVLGLVDRPSEGQYHLFGADTRQLNENRRARLRKNHIGFVFQNYNLIQELTAYENIELALIYQKVPAAKRRKRIKELLDRLQMRPKQHHFPAQLSGGQQQKIAICRAIAGNPDLILADEPTGNLDSRQGKEVMELLKESHEKGSSIVMVTHSGLDAAYAQRKIELKDGYLQNEVPTNQGNPDQT